MQIQEIRPASEALAQVTTDVARAIRSAWAEGRPAQVVLSGGRSGAALGSGIARAFHDGLAGALHVWIADERFVEFDAPDRNDTAIIDALGAGASTLLVHRHLPPSQASLAQAVDDYAHQLQQALGDAPFDAVVLSAGEDGHVASVFPGHARPDAVTYSESHSPKPPSVRTTLSLERLAQTRSCTILVLGASKVDVMARLAAGDEILPAVQLAAITPTTVVTDVTVGMSSS